MTRVNGDLRGVRVRIAGVAMATALALGLGCDKQDGGSPVSPTPPGVPGGGDAVLVGAGDISECGTAGAEQTARLLDGIGGTVFTAGDNAYMHGTAAEFACYDRTWGRHKARTYAAPGNHDYETPNAAGYFAYFGSRVGPGYYAYDVGTWRVLSLDTMAPAADGSAQVQWLRAELQRSRQPCVAAVMHHPLVSSGPNGDNPQVRTLWRVLNEGGVDLVLSGHDHLYERHAALNWEGRPDARGARLITIGTGGARLYATGGLRPTTEAKAAVWGVIKLTLSPTGYRWDFVTVEGVLDSGVDVCH